MTIASLQKKHRKFWIRYPRLYVLSPFAVAGYAISAIAASTVIIGCQQNTIGHPIDASQHMWIFAATATAFAAWWLTRWQWRDRPSLPRSCRGGFWWSFGAAFACMFIVFGTAPLAGYQAERAVRSLVPRQTLIQDAIAMRRYTHMPSREDAQNVMEPVHTLIRWFGLDRPIADNGPEIILLGNFSQSNSDFSGIGNLERYRKEDLSGLDPKEILRRCEAAKADYLKLLPYHEKYAIPYRYPNTARYCEFPASFVLTPSQLDQRYLGFMAHAQAHELSEHGMPVWRRSRRLIKLFSAAFCFAAFAWLAGVVKPRNILNGAWVLSVVTIALLLLRPSNLLLRDGGAAISLRMILLCIWVGSVVVVWRRQRRDAFQECCVIAAVLLPVAMVALDWALDWALNWYSYDHRGLIVPIWWWHDFIKVPGFVQIELLLPFYWLVSVPLSAWLDRYRSLPHTS